jgi:hypothetical protein
MGFLTAGKTTSYYWSTEIINLYNKSFIHNVYRQTCNIGLKIEECDYTLWNKVIQIHDALRI